MVLRFLRSSMFFIGLMSASASQAYSPCEEDIDRLCMHNFHSKSNKECLHENVEKLSPECKSLVSSKKGEWAKRLASLNETQKACKGDLKKQCPKLEGGQKAVLVCIMSNSDEISKECKLQANKHIGKWLPGIKSMD